mmetsp:Transcript_95870/g.271366  ORF Transcript_95870/g.271366 Transcript_95870/m.271366 type:complete len:437 (-) Transcript_95870:23-1333(-)
MMTKGPSLQNTSIIPNLGCKQSVTQKCPAEHVVRVDEHDSKNHHASHSLEPGEAVRGGALGLQVPRPAPAEEGPAHLVHRVHVEALALEHRHPDGPGLGEAAEAVRPAADGEEPHEQQRGPPRRGAPEGGMRRLLGAARLLALAPASGPRGAHEPDHLPDGLAQCVRRGILHGVVDGAHTGILVLRELRARDVFHVVRLGPLDRIEHSFGVKPVRSCLRAFRGVLRDRPDGASPDSCHGFLRGRVSQRARGVRGVLAQNFVRELLGLAAAAPEPLRELLGRGVLEDVPQVARDAPDARALQRVRDTGILRLGRRRRGRCRGLGGRPGVCPRRVLDRVCHLLLLVLDRAHNVLRLRALEHLLEVVRLGLVDLARDLMQDVLELGRDLAYPEEVRKQDRQEGRTPPHRWIASGCESWKHGTDTLGCPQPSLRARKPKV